MRDHPIFRRRTLLLLAVGLFVVAGFVALRLAGGSLHPQAVRDLLRSFGAETPLGPLLLIALLVFVLIVPIVPALVFQIGSGLAFGPVWGLVYVLIADILASAAGFMLARRWGTRILRRWITPEKFGSVERLAQRLNWQTVILLRLLPGPAYPLVSFAAGLSRLGLIGFLTASFAGVAPPLVLIVLSGDVALRSPLLGIAIVIALIAGLTLAGYLFRNKEGAAQQSLESAPKDS